MKKRIIILPAAWSTEKVFLPQIECLQNDYELLFPNIHKFNTVKKMSEYVIQNYENIYAMIGLSMGGYVAQEILACVPRFCHKAVLIGTDSHALPEEGKSFLRNIIEQVQNDKLNDLLNLYANCVLMPESVKDTSLLNNVMQLPLNLSKNELINHHLACIEWSGPTENLQSITAQTLILAGEKDTVIPLENAKILQESIDGSNLKIISNAGHFMTLENPEEVNEMIYKFICHK